MENFFKSFQGQSLIIAIVGLLIVFFIYYIRKNDNIFSVKALTYSAVLLSLGVATNNVKIFSLPQGGSVTLCSMFFIAYIGYIFGIRVGITSGIAFGLLNLLIKPEVYYPAQLIVDYVLAFGALGLSGLFYKCENKFVFAYITAIAGRFIFAFLSGYIFFGQYAPEGWNPMLYSAYYNISYIGTEGIITIILISIPVVSNLLIKIKKMNYKNEIF